MTIIEIEKISSNLSVNDVPRVRINRLQKHDHFKITKNLQKISILDIITDYPLAMNEEIMDN